MWISSLMVHVTGIKESFEAKLHCRNLEGFEDLPGPHSCCDFRHQNMPCLYHCLPNLIICQASLCMMSLNVQTMSLKLRQHWHLILHKDEGVLATVRKSERSLHSWTGMQDSLTWKHMILAALLVPWHLTSLNFHCLNFKVKITQLFPNDPCDHHNLKISD